MKRKWWVIVAAGLAVLFACAYAVNYFYLPKAEQDQASGALLSAAEGLTKHTIEAEFSAGDATLTCTQTIDFINRTGIPLNAVYLRAFANAFWQDDTSPANTLDLYALTYGEETFSPGGLTFTAVHINGATAFWALEGDDFTVLRVTMDEPLSDGESVKITLRYTVTIPDCAYAFGASGGIVALDNVFVTVAEFIGGAWQLDPYYSVGEPVRSERANFQVSLTLPDGWQAASSGENAYAVQRYGLTLSGSYHVAQRCVGDTLVSVYARSRSDARNALNQAVRMLDWYSERYGDYPWPSLSIAQADLPIGSVACDGLCLVPDFSEETLAFAIARQWFGSIAGSDPSRAPWLTLALSKYASLRYFAATRGEDWYMQTVANEIEPSMRLTIARGVTIASPAAAFSGWSEYEIVTELRGCTMLCGLGSAMGYDALDEALADYVQSTALASAVREDFEAAIGDTWVPFIADYLDTHIIAY